MEKSRFTLACIVIYGFFILNFMILIGAITGLVDFNIAINYTKEYLSVFSGLVGVVLGYYFGREGKDS